jgi:hypothetical protein
VNFTGNQSSALRAVLKLHAENQLDWSEELVTGGVDYYPNKAAFGIVLPFADDGTKLKVATEYFFHAIQHVTGVQVLENSYTSYADYTAYLSFAAADARKTEPAGVGSLLSSRLLPRSLFASPLSLDAIVEGVAYGIEKARTFLPRTGTQVVLETPLSNPDTRHSTSALPAWRDAIWHVIHVGEWEALLAPGVQGNATAGFLEMLKPLKELTRGGGAYFNEASYLEPLWESTFFGDNYDKLLETKNRYDPSHIFDCWKCVGWRGENE